MLKLENVVLKPVCKDNDIFGSIGIYADDKLIAEIDEVSDDNTINLFFVVHEGAVITNSLIKEQKPSTNITHELLWSRK